MPSLSAPFFSEMHNQEINCEKFLIFLKSKIPLTRLWMPSLRGNHPSDDWIDHFDLKSQTPYRPGYFTTGVGFMIPKYHEEHTLPNTLATVSTIPKSSEGHRDKEKLNNDKSQDWNVILKSDQNGKPNHLTEPDSPLWKG